MEKLLIEGGVALKGEIAISGAKNAALPLLCAALLTSEPVTFTNVPDLNDVSTMLKLLAQMGVKVEHAGDRVTLDASGLDNPVAPYEMVKTMRAAILVLGPLVARCGETRVSLPGGCAIGARPVDLHLKAFEAMGADIVIEEGYVKAAALRGLKGARLLGGFRDQGAVDLPRLAQLGPQQTLRFEAVTLETAQALYLQREQLLAGESTQQLEQGLDVVLGRAVATLGAPDLHREHAAPFGAGVDAHVEGARAVGHEAEVLVAVLDARVDGVAAQDRERRPDLT